MAFRILDLPDCNIFENFSPELFRTVREGIIRCILATDMARHNEILDQFREAIDDGYEFSNKVHVNLVRYSYVLEKCDFLFELCDQNYTVQLLHFPSIIPQRVR